MLSAPGFVTPNLFSCLCAIMFYLFIFTDLHHLWKWYLKLKNTVTVRLWLVLMSPSWECKWLNRTSGYQASCTCRQTVIWWGCKKQSVLCLNFWFTCCIIFLRILLRINDLRAILHLWYGLQHFFSFLFTMLKYVCETMLYRLFCNITKILNPALITAALH